MTVLSGAASGASNSAIGGEYDRSEAERSHPDVLAALHREPQTQVLLLSAGRVGLNTQGGLLWCAPADVDPSHIRAFLGRVRGRAVLLAILDDDSLAHPPGGWGELRVMGADLDDTDAAIVVTARALGGWIVESSYCPACGAHADLVHAGWSRLCTSCGREHFPRTDPAVIVALTDGERLLLGANAAWPAGRYSCFAGFVEAGESLESTLHREVYEESGIVVSEAEYLGSQAWPYPRSLMLGFIAHTAEPDSARPDGEEIVEVRWFTPNEIGNALADPASADFTLPGPASIARRLITTWHARATAATAEGAS